MSRLLGKRTLRTVLGLLVLIEAIFMAESFTTLMETVVRNGGSVWDLALLLSLKTPEVIDFALPLALLIGIYFAIIGAREENELIVCAAAGVSWTAIPRFALLLGLVGFVASIVVAGYLTPAAKYTQRIATHYLESKRIIAEITDPSPKNTIRQIDGRTIIATPPDTETAVRGNLLIFEPDRGDGWRVSQADDWTVQEGEDGAYVVVLKSFRDYAGRSIDPARDLDDSGASNGARDEARDGTSSGLGETDGSLRRQLQMMRMTVNNLSLDFELEGLIKAVDLARSDSERVLIGTAVLRQMFAAQPDAAPLNRRFGEMIGRALLCPFAALLAVAAAAFSGKAWGRFLALPGAVILVMSADIAARTVLGDATAGGVAAFWGTSGAMALALLAVPLIYILKRRETMIAPERGRG